MLGVELPRLSPMCGLNFGTRGEYRTTLTDPAALWPAFTACTPLPRSLVEFPAVTCSSGERRVPCCGESCLARFTRPSRRSPAPAPSTRRRSRRTCRFFAPDPVSREAIEYAIRAARTAPSGANHQPWHFAVISVPEHKRRLREAAEGEERAFYAGKAGREWLDALAPLGTDADNPYLEIAPWHIVVFGQRNVTEISRHRLWDAAARLA
jgi:hypothetical protein